MATSPITYRISPEVDAELRRLAGLHGGVDKALRVLFGPEFERELAKNIGKHFQSEPLEESPNVVKAVRERLGMDTRESPEIIKPVRRELRRPDRLPLLKPSERKK